MKYSLRIALASLVLLGCVCTSFATITPYNFNAPSSSCSSQQTNPIYLAQDCEGLAAWFASNPPPIGAIDASNGQEIDGYEIRCGDTIIASGGNTGEGNQQVYSRSWGTITAHYSSSAPAPR